MSDVLNLRKEITSFSKAERFDVYSKIIINVTEDLCYEAGDSTGRTLTLSCPWGTQAMANNLLSQMRGFSYQPYTAEGAILNPASELGDGINVNGVYSGIYRIDTTFNSHCSASISAPYDEEINYEFPYESKQLREVKRQNKKFSSQLSIHADRITTEVAERKDDINSVKATLDVQSSQIVAKVNKNNGSSSTFGWALETDSWRIFAGSSTVLKATKEGLEIKGKITATSGTIGGFAINNNHISYNNQTWNGTNTTGIYIGISGIQLGTKFKVDNAGNLYAYSGTFEGTVNAGNIRFGESDDGQDFGTLDGSALSSNSVSGTRLKYSTVSTAYTSAGINTSLGWADYANAVFNGWGKAEYISGKRFYLGDYQGGWQMIHYKDHDGNDRTVRVLAGQ